MSNQCGTMVDVAIRAAKDDERLKPEQREALAKLTAIESQIVNNPVFRAQMGIDVNNRGDPVNEFAHWVMHKLGPAMDPRMNVLTNADVNFLFAEAYKSLDVYHRTKKWGSGDKMHAWINKWIYLPQDVFRRDIIGGSDYFLDTQLLKSDRDRLRSVAKSNLDLIGKRLQTLIGVERRLVDSVLIPAEERLGRAKQDLNELENAPNKDITLIRKMRAEVRNAEAALNQVLRGNVSDPKVSRGLRIVRALQMALDGKFLETDPVTGEEKAIGFKLNDVLVREDSVDTGQGLPPMPILITERKVDRKQLRKVLDEIIGDQRGVNQAAEIANEIGEFLDDFSQITRLGFKAERENMIYRLMRSGSKITRTEAAKVVDRAMNLKLEDIYFPRESVTALNRIERMSVEMDTAKELRDFIEEAARDPEKFAFPGESTTHVLGRTYGLPSTDVSHDMMGVLERYSSRMIDYYHNNQLHLMSNKLLDRIWSVHKSISNAEDARLFEGYVDGVTKYIAEFVDRSKNSVQGGKMNEVMKTLVAWKAGMTMGFFNLSSPILNIAEGQATILIRAGKHYFLNKDKENKWGALVKEFDMGREFTNITEDVMLGTGEAPSLDLRNYSNMDNETRRAVGLVEIDREKIWLRRLASATSELAKKGLVLQKKAENINRARAFKVGALMEWEWLSQYREVFIGDVKQSKDMISDAELDALGVLRSDLEHEGNRREVWKKLAKRRLTRAGFEMVYTTQFNYNQVARHYGERIPIGKLALMYQHYPLSWLATWRRTKETLDGLYRAGKSTGGVRGGVKAMFEPTTKDGHLSPTGKLLAGHSVNNEMQFALITGAIAITLAAIRYNSGIVAGQLFQHPVGEAAEDMVKYVKYGFEGKHEEKKRLFWGRGLVNEFTGPAYTDLMDALSLAALKTGIEDGNMPLWTADILRGTVGFRPNEALLTEFGRRQYHNGWHVMYEAFAFGGMSVAPKAVRLARATPGIGDKIGGNPDGLKGLSYAVARNMGFRDENIEPFKSTKEKEGRL